MNSRLLGTLCIIGSLFGVADAVRMLLLGQPLADGLRDLDTMTSAATFLAAAGGLCGLLGLIALRATGDNPVFRLLTYLPGISYIAAMVIGLGQLTRLLVGDVNNPFVWLIVILGDVLGPLAWLVVAILTIAAKSWQGWRRFVPLAIVLAFPLGIVASAATGLVGAFAFVNYGAAVLLGYAVQTGESRSKATQIVSSGSLSDSKANP